jgi:hypothetical protein
MQQICQRRLRLSSELETVATQYNNAISNRKLFLSTATQQNQELSITNLEALGYRVINNDTNNIVSKIGVMNKPAAASPTATVISSTEDFMNIVSVMNSGGAAATAALAGNYVLSSNLDLSSLGTLSSSLIKGTFTGTFDGQGYAISGLSINSTSSYTGMFAQTSAASQISNVALVGADITSTGSYTGGLVGYNRGTITNSAVEGSVSGVTDVGGLVGYNYNNTITNSYANADVNGNTEVGGLVGYNDGSNADISNSYATGDVTGVTYVGGFVGRSFNSATISDSYATGDVTGSSYVGGFIGKMGWVTINNSYALGDVNGTYAVGGFAGETWSDSASVVNNTCFWNKDENAAGIGNLLSGAVFSAQGLTEAQIASGAYTANGGWNTATWDLSGSTPKLIGTNNTNNSDLLEQYLRNGTYSLAREADEYTQDPINIGGTDYQKLDWRTVPALSDELYTADDSAAEDKYDRTTAEINSQDKKLQLEQANIDTQYKAITSEKEAVKKILDTNAQSSFKYFG